MRRKWKYGFLQVGSGAMAWRVGNVSTTIVVPPGGSRMSALISTVDKLGIDGWELVLHGPFPAGEPGSVYWFKRPKTGR
jgi:hypothetical protein